MRKAILIIVAVRAVTGCATPMSAVREDNHRLTQSVTELRADRRAQDRKIRDLEHQLALAREKSQTESAIPQLPVEIVAPPGASTVVDGQRVVGVADDGSEIIYEGDAASGKPATIDDDPLAMHHPAPPRNDDPIVARNDKLEVTHHIAPVSATPVSARTMRTRSHAEAPVANDAAATEYRGAVDLVRSAKYDDAIAALRGFLQHYPRHDYADNAQYWLGEAFYAQKDYPHALIEFRATIETYPRGNKVPDALLKVGYCYQSLGKADKARAVLEQVVNLYPKTEPAVLAAKRLESP